MQDRRQHGPGRDLLRRQAGGGQPVQHRRRRACTTDMMSAERDACVFFNIERIEKAVKAGKFVTDRRLQGAGGGRHQGRQPGPEDRRWPPTCRCRRTRTASTPAPDGKYFICSGKLSPTATVIELAKVHDWFAGKLKDPRDTVVAEAGDRPRPAAHRLRRPRQRLHHAVPRQPDRQVEHRRPRSSSTRATRTPSTWSTASTCTTSRATCNASHERDHGGRRQVPRGRLQVLQGPLPAGRPAAPGERAADRHLAATRWCCWHDHPVHPEPHDFIIVKRDLVKTKPGLPASTTSRTRSSDLNGVAACSATATRSRCKMTSAGPGLQPERVQGERGRRGHA
ncbi:MAG: hypothetical protein MZW92_74675 [Comamonadaceae bacterium]|nr:hypothetical protein [Comamonadaceae bacterium]